MQDGNPFYAIERELRFERPRWGGWSTLFWAYAILFAIYFTEDLAAIAFISWLEYARPEQYFQIYEI